MLRGIFDAGFHVVICKARAAWKRPRSILLLSLEFGGEGAGIRFITFASNPKSLQETMR